MHNIEHYSYPENCNKKAVQKELDDYVAHADWEEGCRGLYSDIRWIDKVVGSYNEAMKYLEDNDRGCYDCLAVKYRTADENINQTSKYKILNERVSRLYKEYNEMNSEIYMKTVKSELVTCRGCGSTISSKAWKYNTCPVCRTDFRSKTTLERIDNKYKAYKEAVSAMNAYEAEYAKKNGKIYWLVKIEYHT